MWMRRVPDEDMQRRGWLNRHFAGPPLRPKDDPRRRQPSIALARDMMGWQPRVALHKGLRPSIDHFAFS
jgi:nucleoside-diphosphate-sugar epimerase